MTHDYTFTLDRDDLARAIHGALHLEQSADGITPLRLPPWTRAQQADAAIERFAAHTSGVTLRFSTAAKALDVTATFTFTVAPGAQPPPAVLVAQFGTASERVSVGEGHRWVEERDRTATFEPGERSHIRFLLGGDGTTHRPVVIWLPHAAATTLHSVQATAPLAPESATSRVRWVHYGSSISHGSDLADPRFPWPHRVATTQNWELSNLGFAGNAMLDPFVARVIAATDTDLITLKIGINLVTGDAMRLRTFVPALHGFLDTIREGHPHTPIVLITALACPILEDTTGPVREAAPGKAGGTPRDIPAGDGSLTLARTREAIARVVASRDDTLFLVDGLTLLGLDEPERLPDNLHPDAHGHELIATRFVRALRDGRSPLGRAIAALDDAG